MLPDPEHFTRELRELGLNQASVVVVYDSMGMFSSPRAWWMLTIMGCNRLALLDGGLPAWQAAGFVVQPGEVAAAWPPGDFNAEFDARQVADSAAVLSALDDDAVCVLDAGSGGRLLTAWRQLV